MLQDYQITSLPRLTKRGGLAVLVRKEFTFKLNHIHKFYTLEHLDLTINLKNKVMKLILIYRPPSSKKNKFTTSQFLSEFSTLVESIIICPYKILTAGDFNFQIDQLCQTDTSKFSDLINYISMQRHIRSPTHIYAHTLDLLLTRVCDTELISHI